MANRIRYAPEEDPDYKALHDAVKQGDVAKSQAALNPNIDLERYYGTPGDWGVTLFHIAARGGHIEVTRLLLSHGASINSLTDDRFGPRPVLFSAAQAGRAEAVRFLLENGADANFQDCEQRTALNMVLKNAQGIAEAGVAVRIEQCFVDTLEVLLDYGLDINHCPDLFSGVPSVILQAVRIKDMKLVEQLIARGADLSWTLIDLATRPTPEIRELLLRHGAPEPEHKKL